jgi:deoxyribodipyrimidine photo-lyase
MPMAKTALVWFRQDLRLTDNTALSHAVEQGYTVIPVFILDNISPGKDRSEDWKHGAASCWWLHHSLSALNESMAGNLILRKGSAQTELPSLIEETGAQAVFWNRCYEPWRIARDKGIKETLKSNDIDVHTFNASLLWEPWDVLKKDGTPYKVFTPYYRKGCLSKPAPAQPTPAPANITYASTDNHGLSLDDLELLPSIPWDKKLEPHWTPGEKGAQERLKTFLENGLNGYQDDRNRPNLENVSRLSPHLHFGEISPRDVWYAAQNFGLSHQWDTDTDIFCSELGWREFSYYLLYHFPHITWDNLQSKFDAFPWDESDDNASLATWQSGQTGIPIIDAGMRQLYETGWMHNRVRMLVGSMLVKNMGIHWRKGSEWFWDCLVDADLASNSASWQWVAGSGVDAAPYFRIFNPVTQGQKFDPDGDYVRRYVPELKDVPNKFIHCPWDMPVPPKNYPSPILDLKESRQKALAAFETMKKSA